MALDSTKVITGKLVSDSVKIDNTAVGHVHGGVTVTKEVTTIDFHSDYSLTKIGSDQVEVKYIVELSLTEASVSAFMYSLGIASSNMHGTTALIIKDTQPSVVTLEFIVDGGANNDFIVYLHACDYTSGSSISATKDGQLVFPVKFECNAEDNANEIGYIYQIA